MNPCKIISASLINIHFYWANHQESHRRMCFCNPESPLCYPPPFVLQMLPPSSPRLPNVFLGLHHLIQGNDISGS